MRRMKRLTLAFLLFSACTAAQTCPAPPLGGPGKSVNLFTEEQENILGDIIAQQFENRYRPVPGDLNDYLQQVGEKVLRQFPPTKIKYCFMLVDHPEVNAYSFPGGRIFFTRKMITALRSEDELAGLVAHEIGHILSRESSEHFSDLLRHVLGVTSLGDRADITSKYHALAENIAKKPPKGTRHDHEGEQIRADRIGAYGAVRAGYRPQAYGEVWDRISENKGKTGNWLSDFFGSTSPAAKRLKEINLYVASLPETCKPRVPAETSQFAAWRERVVAFDVRDRPEFLPGLISKIQLAPPLRSDIQHFRFSADGKYVLAQDDSNIFVLTRVPLKYLFTISAKDAEFARFTPDSKHIVFHTDSLRVERWEVEGAKRLAVHEIVRSYACSAHSLSPDGHWLACFDRKDELNLLEVQTGKAVFTKKGFYYATASGFDLLSLLIAAIRGSYVNLEFSPDGKYLLAGKGDATLGIDMTTKQPFKLPGSVRDLIRHQFVFLDATRIVGMRDTNRSNIVNFLTGEIIEKDLPFSSRDLGAASGSSNYFFIRPIKDYPVGIYSVEQKKLVAANKRRATDIYGETFIGERRNGEVGIYDVAKPGSTPRDVATLPESELGRVRSRAISPDLRYIALSQSTRGAVWDLVNGTRLYHVRGFRGAHFDGGGRLYTEFPKEGETPRSIARFTIGNPEVNLAYEMKEDDDLRQNGKYVLAMKMPDKKEQRKHQTLEMRSVDTNALLWSREFPKERPAVYVTSHARRVAFAWPLDDAAVKEDVKRDPQLGARMKLMGDKDGDYLVHVLDADTGAVLHKLLIETGKGSISLRGLQAAGHWVMLADSDRRILVYDARSGEIKSRYFGDEVTLSTEGTIAVDNGDGRIDIHKVETGQKLSELTFRRKIGTVGFDDKGDRLLVVTVDQNAFLFDVRRLEQTPTVATK